MAKKEIRTKYIKSLIADKTSLSQILEESTKDSLDSLLDDKVNRHLRKMLAESEDSYTEEEVSPQEPILDTETEDNIEDVDMESSEDTECEDGVCDTETEDENVWADVEDCKDDDGEYDLRGKDIDTVLKIIQSMDEDDVVRIIKNDDDTATVDVEGEEEEFIIDLDGENFDGDETDEESVEDDETTFEIDFDEEESEADEESEDDGDMIEIDFDEEESEETEDDLMNEGNVNLGYTTQYQKKTAMTMPSDKDDADSRFDNGAPKGGSNNGRRWVGTKGANNGNPYSKKIDECGKPELVFEFELDEEPMEETHTRGMARKHNSVGRTEVPNTNCQSDETDTRNVFVAGSQKRNCSRNNVNENKIQNITRKANAILAENKELREIATEIKNKLNEAVVINSSLAKVIKLMTENSTTKNEKIDILNRFNKVTTLNESRELYSRISEELKNSHNINNKNMLNNTLTETKSENKNLIIETNMLSQDNELKQVLDLQRRLSNL